MKDNTGTILRLLAAVFAVGAAVAAYCVAVAPRWLRTNRLNVYVPGLPEHWEGVKVAHLSDFHLGARGMGSAHLHEARRVALEFEPDLIALTGDFYDMGNRIPSEGLYSDWPSGVPVLAVMGNHDRRPEGSLEETIQELELSGVIVLMNAATRVSLRQHDAWIVGIDDAHTFSDNVEKAFCDVPDGETALLALSHAPTPILDVQPGQARIMLSGHTHGGQIRLLPSGAVPFINLIRKVLGSVERPEGPVYRGWHWINGTILIISEGLGVSTLPIRFRTRPQLILLELHEGAAHSDLPCDDIDRYVEEIDPEPWLVRWLT